MSFPATCTLFRVPYDILFIYSQKRTPGENAVTSFGISLLVYASVFTSMMYRKARSSTGGILRPKNIKASLSNHYRGPIIRHNILRDIRTFIVTHFIWYSYSPSKAYSNMLSRKQISLFSRDVLDRTIRACMPLRPRMEVSNW